MIAPDLVPRLRTLLRGGRSLVLVRHGNTDRPATGGDLSRKLTDKGRKQCRLASQQWFSPLGDNRLAMSSKAGRCKETIRLLLGDATVPVSVLPSIYDSPEVLE